MGHPTIGSFCYKRSFFFFLSVLNLLFFQSFGLPFVSFFWEGGGENINKICSTWHIVVVSNLSSLVCIELYMLVSVVSQYHTFCCIVWLFQCKGLPKRLVRANIMKHRRSASLGLLKMVRSSRC